MAPSSTPHRPHGPRDARDGNDSGRYLALCPHPTEPLVAEELSALPRVTDVEIVASGKGAVSFRGPPAALYRANLWLRCATRVLKPLSDQPCRGERDLYEQARGVPWEDYLRQSGTLAVSAHGQVPGLSNSMFSALRVKDAIVDRFRDRYGTRPDVDPRDPDVQVNVQLYLLGRAQDEARCALSLDSSGQALHRRGYRQSAAAAPLKETLAAAMVALSGYGRPGPLADAPPRTPLYDLCCGSGTLVIEGGLRALARAPGLYRPFGFQRWLGFDAGAWRQVLAEAEALSVPEGKGDGDVFLYGSDIDGRVIEAAQHNARAAGLSRSARFRRGDLALARPQPGPPGVVLCNPPYGERMGEEQDLIPLYRSLGDTLKRHFAGHTAFVFTANLALAKQIGLRASERHVLYNGKLEGRLLRFNLY